MSSVEQGRWRRPICARRPTRIPPSTSWAIGPGARPFHVVRVRVLSDLTGVHEDILDAQSRLERLLRSGSLRETFADPRRIDFALDPVRRPRALVRREERPARNLATVEFCRDSRPTSDERAGRRPVSSREPRWRCARGREPLGHALQVLLALQAADELGAAIAEDVVIDRSRALRAEQAGDAVLATLGEQPDQRPLAGGFRGPGGDVVARLVQVEQDVRTPDGSAVRAT